MSDLRILTLTVIGSLSLILPAMADDTSTPTAPQQSSPPAIANGAAPAQKPGGSSKPQPTGLIALPAVTVTGAPDNSPSANAVSPQVTRYALPQTVESIDKKQIDTTTNTVDVEDALKYLPSIFVRKRNYGDTQPTIATRTWGVNSSARSLVYVDDIPITALISNNNTTGAPRWGMVSPEAIEGIDVLYGPFAAEYPGNSMGGVLLLTTRMPDQFEATAKQTGAVQTFDKYKTHDAYGTSNSNVTVGDKIGRFSWFLTGTREDSYSQPLAFITSSGTPAGTTGTIPAKNKTGATANVVGAGGLLHSVMYNATGKAAIDLTDWLRASYMVGYWNNDTRSKTDSYLQDASGNTTYGGVSGFANNTYTLDEQHLMNALSLKSDTGGNWDGEIVATRYDYLQDIQRSPASVLGGDTLSTNGRIARMDGTNWMTLDLKGIWRPTGIDGDHELSFGLHGDRYELDNPTYNTSDWRSSPDNGDGSLYTDGKGKTGTYAAWAQDAWKFAPGFTLTVGGRAEYWRAFDGYNLSGNVSGSQPNEHSTNFSPKATLAWQVDPAWNAKFSFGQAYRYPTVSELYQIVSTGSTFAIPNANLKPESVKSFEFAVERKVEKTRLRLSLFQENTSDALIQQTNTINGTPTTVWTNVNKVRNRGVEFVAEQKDLFIPGLDVSNSVTYVDSRILSDPNFVSTTGTTAKGKHVPYVPDWRDTVQVTYHPTDELSLFAAARYSGKMYSTIDNTDTKSHVMGAFDKFFVVDTHAHYQFMKAVSADIGVDNLLNEKYFEYHPFPGRTYVASLQVKF